MKLDVILSFSMLTQNPLLTDITLMIGKTHPKNRDSWLNILS